jgi:hypothetical protein
MGQHFMPQQELRQSSPAGAGGSGSAVFADGIDDLDLDD